MKGITPIISIIILLLITVGIAAGAWTFISGYWGGLVGSAMEITSTICKGGTNATIYVHNMGTSNLNIQNGQGLDIERTQGSGTYAMELVYEPANGILEPGGTGKITDINCTESGVQQRCAYEIVELSSGRLHPTFTTCSG
jgi:flagellin-like protein